MLVIKNITKKFGEKVVLDNVSLEVKKGEIVGFLGPNGAGKTTTMRLIVGFLTPNEGQIKIDGKAPKEARKIIGYLPEENPLYPLFTPFEYLSFIGKAHSISKENLLQKIKEVAANCGLTEYLNQKIETLSRGYRQRVGLAATLIHNPKLIIMDEPTTGLDPNQQEEIRNLIKKISKDKAIIFSTHILSEVESICQRAVFIHKGKIVGEEKIENLKKSKKSLEKIFHQLTKN